MTHSVRRLPGQTLLQLELPRALPDSDNRVRVRGRRKPLWYAVSIPGLLDPAVPALERSLRLRQAAELARHLSDRISLFPPNGFVFEMRSSLRYFGGADAIRIQLQNLLESRLQDWGIEPFFFQSVTPAPAASMLLAKNGANALVYQTDSLRSALGQLPTASLPVSARQKKQLEQSGLFYLRDIWRLPGAALRQRFGSELADYLDCCLGKKKEQLGFCEPLPVFRAHVELEYAEENVMRLLPMVQDLCARLRDYLRQQGLCTTHMLLQLQHEQQEAELIELNLRRPTHNETHLLMLLENRLGAMTLCAPVTALVLETRYFDAFVGRTDHLLADARIADARIAGVREDHTAHDEHAQSLIEQLQSRLGNEAVKMIRMHEEHCPEFASLHFCHGDQQPPANRQSICYLNRTEPRPVWLLDQPESLLHKDGLIFHINPITNSRLTIISEAERIESRWWQGPDIRRDYYIASDEEGHRYWIYHSRNKPAGWYLHGIF